MKQIKAFIHRNRVSDAVQGLRAAGFSRLSLFDVKGLLQALSARELEYSVALGGQVVSEVQLELFCEDDEVDAAVAIFRRRCRTGHADSGWIYVSDVEQAWAIEDGAAGSAS